MGAIRGILLALPLLLAQTAPKPVPVGQEPRHHVMFANEYVRVIDAALAPGEITLFHTHSRDNVPVSISGGLMRTEVLGGGTTTSSVEAGGVWFAKATYSHEIANIGKTNLRFIDVELVSSPEAETAAPERLEDVPGLHLEIDNQRVRVYRIRLDPGQSTGAHSHGLPGLEVVVRPGRVRTTIAGSAETVEAGPGEFTWRPGPGQHSIENVGDSSFEAFWIEWKATAPPK